jgi:hypothetical protein
MEEMQKAIEQLSREMSELRRQLRDRPGRDGDRQGPGERRPGRDGDGNTRPAIGVPLTPASTATSATGARP